MMRFTKASLRRDLGVEAIRALLVPRAHDARASASHHLIWSLFSDAQDRRRDFLWREHAPGEFYLLSERDPVDRHGLFDLLPPKPYLPALGTGDALRFDLRVNATTARSRGGGSRGIRSDIVMQAIHGRHGSDRAEARRIMVEDVAADWMAGQGARNGFEVASLTVRAYDVLKVARAGGATATFGILDLSGVILVRDPDAVARVLCHGIGRAKAFGCGLLLVRRE